MQDDHKPQLHMVASIIPIPQQTHYDGLPIGTFIKSTSPDLSHKVVTSKGIVDVPRCDLVDVGEVKYDFSTTGPEYMYRYILDNSDPTVIALNHDSSPPNELPIMSSSGEPHGWRTCTNRWIVDSMTPSRGSDSVYWCLSSYRPGLVPMYFHVDNRKLQLLKMIDNEDRGLPMTESLPEAPMPVRKANTENRMLDNWDEQLVMRAMAYVQNSVRIFVIGPTFPPNASNETVMQHVRCWVDEYGFEFLRPFSGGMHLDSLHPTSVLEKDITACLQHVTNL